MHEPVLNIRDDKFEFINISKFHHAINSYLVMHLLVAPLFKNEESQITKITHTNPGI